jgi:hypothetical protein
MPLLLAEDEQEVVDGWDMVQRPAVWHPDASALSGGPGSPHFLPPPPSRPADVHNWERAMFTDRRALSWLFLCL